MSDVAEQIRTMRSQGAEVVADGVRYRTWTQHPDPEVVIFGPDGAVRRALPLTPDDGSGYHSVVDAAGQPGDLYKYRFHGNLFPDPASMFQPQGVHGPSQVCTPNGFQWKNAEHVRIAMPDLIIYEMHAGTFTPGGTFRSAIEKLPYLLELGITAVEVMPVGDFAGTRNWGYDGVMLYAPAHAYGTPDDLRAFVDAAHGHGLAVILDVVYNHLGPEGNYMGAFHSSYFDRRRKTPWGDSLNYAEPAVRSFFVENPAYWMTDFHIDGFRMDATHAIHDESYPHILGEMTDVIHAGGGIVVAEDERNERALCLPTGGMGLGFDGVWADDFHHVVRVSALNEREGHYANFRGTTDELIDTLSNGWLYRGQRQLNGGAERGTECLDLGPEQFVYCISNHDQVGNQAFGERLGQRVDPAVYRAASAFFLLAPYTPMLFMGQEWNATTPFQFFTDHNPALGRKVTEGRRREFRGFSAFADPDAREKIPDPQSARTFLDSKLKWDETNSTSHRSVLALYREAIRLRKEHPALQDRSRANWKAVRLPNDAVAILYGSRDLPELIVAMRLGDGPSLQQSVESAALAGRWQRVLSSNESRFGGDLNASGAPETIVLQADDRRTISARSTSGQLT